MIINNVEILPGKTQKLEIPIANLPSGIEIDLIVHTFRAKKPGPTLLLLGGVHGNEINGVEIVRRAVRDKVFKQLKAGCVIAIPLTNVYGFNSYAREFPGNKDVNRSFPGSKGGSLASRIAHTLTTKILPHVDYALDFHTGGQSVYNYPQARVYREDAESMKLAKMFAMPYIIKTGLIKRSLRSTAHKMEIPMVVFEGGESLRIDELSVEKGIKGIRKVMHGLKIKPDNLRMPRPVTLDTSKWIRASRSGMFRSMKISGDHVKKGDLLGIITDPYSSFTRKIICKKDGVIYGHNNNPVVSQGEALFHLGYLEES